VQDKDKIMLIYGVGSGFKLFESIVAVHMVMVNPWPPRMPTRIDNYVGFKRRFNNDKGIPMSFSGDSNLVLYNRRRFVPQREHTRFRIERVSLYPVSQRGIMRSSY